MPVQPTVSREAALAAASVPTLLMCLAHLTGEDRWLRAPYLPKRDVALFAIKGMSTAEIASLRSTSEGTVKAQTNAIYRKAGVSGRSQLLSLFIEDLMRDDGAVRPMPPATPEAAA